MAQNEAIDGVKQRLTSAKSVDQAEGMEIRMMSSNGKRGSQIDSGAVGVNAESGGGDDDVDDGDAQIAQSSAAAITALIRFANAPREIAVMAD